MKATIIALSASALITAAPAVPAQGIQSKTPALQHKVSKKHHPGGYAPRRGGASQKLEEGLSWSFGHAHDEPIDRDIAASRQAGGGGGM
jgi:hypothetical protein